MNMRIFFGLVSICLSFFLITPNALAQDVIELKKGKNVEVNGRVVSIDKKKVNYKNYNDPEFTTQNFPIQKVKRIRYEDGTIKNIRPFVSSWIGFSGGATGAVGDFNKDSKDGAGYAGGGKYASWQANLYFSPKYRLGITLKYAHHENKFNENSLYENFSGVQFNGNGSGNGKSQWSLDFTTIGICHSIPIGFRSCVEQHVTVGTGSLRRPNVSIAVQYRSSVDNFTVINEYLTSERSVKQSSGFSYGIGYRYNINNRIGFRLFFEYTYAVADFNIRQNYSLRSTNTAIEPDQDRQYDISYTQVLTNVTSGITIAYQFRIKKSKA